jgi:hypothetical protein
MLLRGSVMIALSHVLRIPHLITNPGLARGLRLDWPWLTAIAAWGYPHFSNRGIAEIPSIYRESPKSDFESAYAPFPFRPGNVPLRGENTHVKNV